MGGAKISEIIDGFHRFMKKYPIYGYVLSVLLGGLMVNLLSNYLPSIFGLYNLMKYALIIALLITCILISHFFIIFTKKPKFQAFEPLEKTYKGLIVSISRIIEPKDVLIDKINKLNCQNEDELKELFDIRGVGQTLKAINYHLETLEVCWLLYTNESVDGKDVVKYFIKKFGSGINPKPILIEKPFDIKSTYRIVNEIYVKEIGEYNLSEKDVIADITGGTTPMSSAIMIVCNSSTDRDVEYIDQNIIEIKSVEHT